MQSQQVILDDRRLNYKDDCWCCRSDKMVPLDRIQDVNIQENCIHRCCGVANVTIQTAGGGERPEIVVTAPKNPQFLRDRIMIKRDAFVHRHNAAGDGTSAAYRSPDSSSASNPLLPKDTAAVTQLNDTLLRIEALMAQGIEKL